MSAQHQRPQTRPVTLCNEHLQVKIYGQKGLLGDSLCHTYCSFHDKTVSFFPSFSFKFCFNFGEHCRGKGRMQRDGEMIGIKMHDVKDRLNK